MALVIERTLRVGKAIVKAKGYSYEYGSISIKLPREAIGKEAKVIVIIR